MNETELTSRAEEKNLVQVYECLRDLTRLRILNLLMHSALCVCHLEQIIGGPQARISRHLAYLRGKEVVTVRRYHNWNIYQIQVADSRVLALQLKCLQDCAQEMAIFKDDQEHLLKLKEDLRWIADFMDGKPVSAPPSSSGCR